MARDLNIPEMVTQMGRLSPPEAERLRARDPRRQETPKPALRGHAARDLLLVRRWRHVALTVAEPAGRAGVGHLGGRHRSDDRDARPLVLHPRRRRTAATVRSAIRVGQRHGVVRA